ncbi:MAG: hypothetical protein J0M17_04735, partial [Planctomycetes bacterium]|nr:hypothetical protein [Planctomycetota bacterium]
PKSSSRPAWVDRPGLLNGGTYETKVLVGPETTRAALDRATQEAVRAKIVDYATTLAGPDAAAAALAEEAKLRSRVVGEEWEEHVRTAAGDSLFLHTQLKFDAQLQNQWLALARERQAATRNKTFVTVFLTAIWIVLLAHAALRVEAGKPRPAWRIAAWAAALILAGLPWAYYRWQLQSASATTAIVVPAGASVDVRPH